MHGDQFEIRGAKQIRIARPEPLPGSRQWCQYRRGSRERWCEHDGPRRVAPCSTVKGARERSRGRAPKSRGHPRTAREPPSPPPLAGIPPRSRSGDGRAPPSFPPSPPRGFADLARCSARGWPDWSRDVSWLLRGDPPTSSCRGGARKVPHGGPIEGTRRPLTRGCRDYAPRTEGETKVSRVRAPSPGSPSPGDPEIN